nr:Ketol-acid reductoisomerase [Klebsiella pneumoniae]
MRLSRTNSGWPRSSSRRWIWRESVDGLTCMARALRQNGGFPPDAERFSDRVNPRRVLPGFVFHKMQRDVVNISISAIKFLSYSKFILAKANRTISTTQHHGVTDMANYFNTLNLRQQLAQLGKCRFMARDEFADGASYLQGKSGHRRLRRAGPEPGSEHA